MTNRREFLQRGVAVSALSLTINELLPGNAEAAWPVASSVALHKAIFDPRYAEGRTFADVAREFRVPVHAIEDGDVTDLWYGELDLVWRRQSAAIAGLTQVGPLFVLERLANERGMRVRLRVEHRSRDDGSLEHVMSAPPETVALAERLSDEGVAWPAMMAALVTSCRADRALVERTVVTIGAKPAFERDRAGRLPASPFHYYTPRAIQEGHDVPLDGPLFSWVIAPSLRA